MCVRESFDNVHKSDELVPLFLCKHNANLRKSANKRIFLMIFNYSMVCLDVEIDALKQKFFHVCLNQSLMCFHVGTVQFDGLFESSVGCLVIVDPK